MNVVASDLVAFVCCDGVSRMDEEECGTSADPRTLATALYHQQMRAEVSSCSF